MNKRKAGFTIIELLVVIAIIGFLASALAVAAVGLAARSRIEKTGALVRRLDAGCEAYKVKFQDYPSKFAKLTAADVKAGTTWPAIVRNDVMLFDLLAKPLVAIEGFTAGTAKKRNLDPFIEVVESERKGDVTAPDNVQIIDAWEQPTFYSLPGANHGANYPDHSNRTDVESNGPDKFYRDGSYSGSIDAKDDVCNWTVERK